VTGRCRAASAIAGISLLDLLLALALGLVVVAALVQLFAASSRSYAVAMSQARLAEDARVALEILARAARAAGYLGCNAQPLDLVKGLAGAWHEIPEYDVTRPVQGYGARGDGWEPALHSLPISEGRSSRNVHLPGHGIDTRTLVPGSDLVVFRSLGAPLRQLAGPLWPGGEPVVLAPGGDPGFGVGAVVMIADCVQAAVFQMTGMVAYGDQVRLRHDPGSDGSRFENAAVVATRSGNLPFTLNGAERPYGADGLVGPVISTWFFVAPGAGRDARGDPIPALWHKPGSGRPVELVQGVEQLQVWFGLAADPAEIPLRVGRYLRAGGTPGADEPDIVVSVRIRLTMAAIDAAAEGDRTPRRTFDRTIMLRNAAPPVAS